MHCNDIWITTGCTASKQCGIQHMEKIAVEVCGYASDYSGVMMNFFEDNPGAIEAVIKWIGNQRNSDWNDNLESLVGPDEDEIGDLAPREEKCLSKNGLEL